MGSLLAMHFLSEFCCIGVEAWEVFRRMVGYFSHGIPVVWVVIGWLGFVVHWSAVFSAMSALKVQDQQDSGSVF